MTTTAFSVDTAFQQHRRLLWHLCYRMTGIAADADDLVQETFLRAIERPPPQPDAELRPWLVRVAMNLARDLLRRRRRRKTYVGPWLPTPIDTDDDGAVPAVEATVAGLGSTEGRYDLVESVTFAFLLALEALTPQQRAVLLLRDVFDYSVHETATALAASDAAVKTTHHRARHAMAAYDRSRRPPTRDLCAETKRALTELIGAVFAGDTARAEATLSADVRAVTDGGGEFHAARLPVVGREKVARFFARLAARRAPGVVRADIRTLNGLPALVADFGTGRPGDPPRGVIRIDLGPDGLIRTVHSVLATRKLAAVSFA
jgi:RNA polymerase sigma-70 factor (ECF subfamily)